MSTECTCCEAIQALAERVARLEAERDTEQTTVVFDNKFGTDGNTKVFQATNIDNLTIG